jgi:hypothetical protein
MDAYEAVKLGLADHVGIPTVTEKPISNVEYTISLENIQKPVTMRQNPPKPVKKGKKK